ncbi:fibronectin [Lingula anatina]|uniref:Fibronectin n=1 Tax=Lingula anatina TaxID=7574 RepID=A0A1S3HVT0_LINAN|nr:fibronectin [Lingula anatina]|eukprot:XP_013389656.1 fibronectin [Lingula anatina]
MLFALTVVFCASAAFAAPDFTVCKHNGEEYKQGEEWHPSDDIVCQCISAVNNATSCTSICPQYTHIPKDCSLVDVSGEACPKLSCDWEAKCRSNGTWHDQDEEWYEGCNYKCKCTDAKRGLISCQSACTEYTLIPPNCKLLQVDGECCRKLVCGDELSKIPPSQIKETTDNNNNDASMGCYDIQFNCADYGQGICTSAWARENCAKSCGFCATNEGNSNGNACVFPFNYKGRQVDSCILSNADYPWCSTTSQYDQDKKWGYCHAELMKTRCKDTDGTTECNKYAKESCGAFKDWAKGHCERYCGLCENPFVPSTTPAPTTTPVTTSATTAVEPPTVSMEPVTNKPTPTPGVPVKETPTPAAATKPVVDPLKGDKSTLPPVTQPEVTPIEGSGDGSGDKGSGVDVLLFL